MGSIQERERFVGFYVSLGIKESPGGLLEEDFNLSSKKANRKLEDRHLIKSLPPLVLCFELENWPETLN